MTTTSPTRTGRGVRPQENLRPVETTDDTTGAGDLLRRARAAMPGRTAVEQARADAQQRLASLRAFRDEYAAIRAAVDAATNGPVDLEQAVNDTVAAHDANQRQHSEAAVLTRLVDQLTGRLGDVDRDHADAALAVVRDEIAGIVREAKPVLVALGQVDSADAAIDAGVGDQWRAANQLARRHRAARGVQATLVHGALAAADGRRTLGSVAPTTRRLVERFGTVAIDTEDPQPHEVDPDPLLELRAVVAAGAVVPDVADLLAIRDTGTTSPSTTTPGGIERSERTVTV